MMKKIWLFLVVLGVCKGFGAYKESSFYFDNGKTPRAIHYTAQGFKASTTYLLKLYVKDKEEGIPLYFETLSKDEQWIKPDEDTWQESLPSFTTLDNGYQEGWVYVRNSGIEAGTYNTCAFSVREGTSGETMKPGVFRPATIMENPGWLEGIVKKDGEACGNSHIVFLNEYGSVSGCAKSEQNGYFKIALPDGIKIATITDWDGNLYDKFEIAEIKGGEGISISSNEKITSPWPIFAGKITTLGYEVLNGVTKNVVIINEIMYDAPGTIGDAYGEWIELYNPATGTIDLTGWKLYDPVTRTLSGTISGGGYLVLVESTETFTCGTYGYNLNGVSYIDVGALSLEDNFDTLVLKDNFGKIVDILHYNKNWGTGAPDSGRTLEKILAKGPNVDGNWDSTLDLYGTPGKENSVSGRGTICGTVRDSQGGTISGALVIARPYNLPTTDIDDGSNIGHRFGTKTDSNGFYTLFVPPGNYIVIATKEDYARAVATASVTKDSTTEVNFYLKRLGIITGTVGSGTTGIAGAKVEAIIRWKGGLHYVAKGTFTDNKGSYTISGLKDGTYTVVVSHPEYKSGTRTAVVSASETTTCDFQLEYKGPLPNLTMKNAREDIWWKPKYPTSGALMRIFARVWNLGSETSGTTSVEFWQSNWGINQDWGENTQDVMLTADGTRKHFLGTASIPPIAPGSRAVCSIIYRPPHSGLNNILVKIDPPIESGGIVVEQYELDNVFSRCIRVIYLVKDETLDIPVGNPLSDAEEFNLALEDSSLFLSGNQMSLDGLRNNAITLTLTPPGTRIKVSIRAVGSRMGTQGAEIIVVSPLRKEAVGNDEGTVTADDGTRVHIPQGALNRSTNVILNSNIDPDSLANVNIPGNLKDSLREFLLEDMGTFSKNVRITIPYPAGLRNPRIFWLNEEEERWEMVNTIIGTDNTVSADVSHFSIYGIQEATITTISVLPTQTTVTSVGTASFTATAYDEQNQPLSNIDFSWSINPQDGATITRTGTNSAIFTGTKTGTYEITAGTESKTGTATIVVTIGTATELQITLSTNTITADGTATISGIIQDEQGNTETTTALELSAENGSIANSIFYPDKVGIWTITGTYTPNPALTATTQICVTPGIPFKILLTYVPKVAIVNDPVTIFGSVTDKYENLIEGTTTIYWTAAKGTLSATSTITSDNGTATITGTFTKGGFYTITATTTNLLATTTIFVAAGEIGSQTKGSITYRITSGTLTAWFGTATEDYYPVIEEDTTGLANLKNNIGVGIRIELYDINGNKLAATTTQVYIEIPLPQNHDKVNLRIYLLSDGIIWSDAGIIQAGYDTNFIRGTLTHLSYIGIAGTPEGQPNLDAVFAYPNPWKKKGGPPEIIFKRLTANATIRIFNVAGEEVCNPIPHNDGSDEQAWTVPEKLASGVYIALIEGGGGKKIIKLGIIK
ncbi:MAG: carboxypeptidase regulatory-like domain-containing protein [bacterium]